MGLLNGVGVMPYQGSHTLGLGLSDHLNFISLLHPSVKSENINCQGKRNCKRMVGPDTAP